MAADDDQDASGFGLLVVVVEEDGVLDEFSVVDEELVDVARALDATVELFDETVEVLDGGVVEVLDAVGVLEGLVTLDVAEPVTELEPVVPLIELASSGCAVVWQPWVNAATNPMPTASLSMKRSPEATRQA